MQVYQRAVRNVAASLMREGGYSLQHLDHADTSEMRGIVHQLLVVRAPPYQVTDAEEDLYQQVDALLQFEQKRVEVIDASQLPTIADAAKSKTSGVRVPDVFRHIGVWKGDITSLNATAIVNAANSAMLGCFQPSHKCIDNVIHSKAGPRLRAACAQLMEAQGHEEPVGHAKITDAFALPSQFVIHTVGPALQRGSKPTPNERAQLQACYTSSLNALKEKLHRTPSNKPVTVVFPCISTGLFAFPSDVAAEAAILAVRDWLLQHSNEVASWKVVFNTFLPADFALYKNAFENMLPGLVVPPPSADPSLEKALKLIKEADYLLISAGSGLSTAAGLDFGSTELMKKTHPNLGNVCPELTALYRTIQYRKWSEKVMWAFYLRESASQRFNGVSICNAPTYETLRKIYDYVDRKQPNGSYVVTSNCDGLFEQYGYPIERIFNKQGDWALLQCKNPCRPDAAFDARPFIKKALESFNPETYEIEDPEGIPKCPYCGGKMAMLLREDDLFLESALSEVKKKYRSWLKTVTTEVENQDKKFVILEIGAGFNTPSVLRFPDEDLATMDNVSLVRVSMEDADIPFDSNGVGVSGDANEVLEYLARNLEYM